MKVLVIGPSDRGSRGGMAAVARGIRESGLLNREFEIDVFPSYIDGNLLVRLLYSIFGCLRFLRIYRKYDLFHINTAERGSTFRKSFYLRRVKKAGKKAIIHIHGAEYLEFCDGLGPWGKRFVENFLRGADLVLALSEGWKRELEERFHLDNCRTLNNGVDVSEFSKAAGNAEANRNSFLFLGRLGARKGVYDLIEAAESAVRENPELRICIAGDGEVERVRRLVGEKGLERHVTVLGWIDGAQKMECLKNAATVVLPSYNEGLPVSILEGMAAGKAIIGTPVGAVPEVVGEENGILVKPGDISGLAQALLRCSSDLDLLKDMSCRNMEKAERIFDVGIMHERLADYYRQAAGEGERSGWTREDQLSA